METERRRPEDCHVGDYIRSSAVPLWDGEGDEVTFVPVPGDGVEWTFRAQPLVLADGGALVGDERGWVRID